MSATADRQPTVEDYHSEDDETASFSRKQANIAAKRSNPSDLGKEKPIIIENASDSGYSSHTTATMGSADSAQSMKAAADSAQAPAPPADNATRRQPALDTTKKTSSSGHSSPKKAPSLSSSQTGRPRRETVSRRKVADEGGKECTIPNCRDCGRNQSTRRPKASPLQTGLNTQYPSYTSPDRIPLSPPSPATQHAYAQGYTIVQPGQSRRRSSATNRPVSYHEGMIQPLGPNTFCLPPPTPMGGVPPMGFSTHYPTMYGATPPNAGFYGLQQTSPPYEYAPGQPIQQHMPAETYSPRRPASIYGHPQITYGDHIPPPTPQGTGMPSMSARYPSQQLPSNPSMRATAVYDESETESASEDDQQEGYDQDRVKMPPPTMVPSRSASVRRTPDGQNYSMRMNSINDRDDERESEYHRISRATSRPPPISNPPSRHASNRRPSLASSGRTKATSYSNSSGSAPMVTVESTARRQRRTSYMGHEHRAELMAERHDRDRDLESETYDDYPEPERRSAREGRLRRQTESDTRQRMSAAEAYQRRSRGDREPQPLTESALHSRRTTNLLEPDSKSTHSKSSLSHRAEKAADRAERASRVSASNRTTATQDNDGKLRMLVNTNNTNIEFLGDMGGKTISLRPIEGSTAELTIASNGSRSEKAYRTSSSIQGDARSVRSAKNDRGPVREITNGSATTAVSGRRPTRSERAREREQDRDRVRDRERGEREQERERERQSRFSTSDDEDDVVYEGTGRGK